MFKLVVCAVEDASFKDKSSGKLVERYLCWFKTSKGLGCLYSSHKVDEGATVNVEVYPGFSTESFKNRILSLRIVD